MPRGAKLARNRMTPPAQLAAWLHAAKRAVAFTGAGISTESQIPDFRSPGGVWARYSPVYYQDFLAASAARVEYWRQKSEAHRDFAAARPNRGHEILARWEATGRLRAVVTQNIDELHQAAGSRAVVELHGTAKRVACLECGARYDADPMVAEFQATGVPPNCANCGGLTKHATISFGQNLVPDVLLAATKLARECDLFLALGSSLVVTPAADLPRLAQRRGARLAIINREPTPLDANAELVIHGPLGETLAAIDWELQLLTASS